MPREELSRCAPHPLDRAAARRRRGRIDEFLAGRSLLRRLLRHVQPELSESLVETGSRGEPLLPNSSEHGVSISHDHVWVAAAFTTRGRVGVDIQTPPAQVSELFLRRCGLTGISALPGPLRAREAAWAWTAREACGKALGVGLAGRPWEFDLPPGGREGRWKECAWVSLRGESEVPLSCAVSRVPSDQGRDIKGLWLHDGHRGTNGISTRGDSLFRPVFQAVDLSPTGRGGSLQGALGLAWSSGGEVAGLS